MVAQRVRWDDRWAVDCPRRRPEDCNGVIAGGGRRHGENLRPSSPPILATHPESVRRSAPARLAGRENAATAVRPAPTARARVGTRSLAHRITRITRRRTPAPSRLHAASLPLAVTWRHPSARPHVCLAPPCRCRRPRAIYMAGEKIQRSARPPPSPLPPLPPLPPPKQLACGPDWAQLRWAFLCLSVSGLGTHHWLGFFVFSGGHIHFAALCRQLRRNLPLRLGDNGRRP